MRAASIIQKEILRECEENEDREIKRQTFDRQSEKESISQPVLSFVNMVLHGSDVLNDIDNANNTRTYMHAHTHPSCFDLPASRAH